MRRSIPTGAVSPRWVEAVREVLETLQGMRGVKLSQLPPLRSRQITAAPTQADFNNLQADLLAIHGKLNALLARSDGEE